MAAFPVVQFRTGGWSGLGRVICLALLLSRASKSAGSQVLADTAQTRALTIGAMATTVLTRVAPAYNGRTFTEVQLVQPALMAAWSRRGVSMLGVVNAEGYTLQRGELNPGIAGEGYVDRRHPHTLVHEAMVTWQPNSRVRAPGSIAISASIAAGRGFVPFGSDDPMMRPIGKYPANHHYAQIIERLQAITAVQFTRGPQALTLEGATFNGDEPAGPFHGPRWSRIGDSWSLRATAQPARGVELSVSEASIISPELQQGGAFDHRQQHAALRIDRRTARGDARYLLAEWARTDEVATGLTAFRYYSKLVEGEYGAKGASATLRFEQTDRGEQSRLFNPFRTPLGHADFQILGVTQWHIMTVALQAPSMQFSRRGPGAFAPFVEMARAVPTPRRRPTVFEPVFFYGAATLWSLSVGLRLHAGSMRPRMGRYGVLSGSAAGPATMQHGLTHGSNHDR